MADDLVEQVLQTWRTNNGINLFLLRNLREGGLDAVTLLKNGQPSKGRTVLLLGYLLAHEAHHRGQIVLALKQSGLRLPDEIAYGLWTYWQGYIYRKDNKVPRA